MSRSYRKNPIVKSNTRPKFDKRYANKLVRLYPNIIPKGGKYKTLYQSTIITSYISRVPLSKFLSDRDTEYQAFLNDGIRCNPMINNRINTNINEWKKVYLCK